MYSKRTDTYLTSFKDVEKATNLLNLEIDSFKNTRVRDPYVWNYVRAIYDENYLILPKLIKLIPFEEGKFNLKTNATIKNGNIFFNLYVKTNRNPVIQLVINGITLLQISLKGSKVFCRGLRKEIAYEREIDKYKPIYLFEQLEKKFLDIWDIPHYKDVNITIECSEPVELICEISKYSPQIIYRNTTSLIEEYCIFENIKEIKGTRQEDGKYLFDFTSKRISPLFYIALPIKIRSIRVFLSKINYWIEFYDPRIIFRYLPNFHLIHLFQSNNADFLREGETAPLGINLSVVGYPIRIEIEVDANEKADNIVANVGIFEFNVLSYQGMCRGVF